MDRPGSSASRRQLPCRVGGRSRSAPPGAWSAVIGPDRRADGGLPRRRDRRVGLAARGRPRGVRPGRPRGAGAGRVRAAGVPAGRGRPCSWSPRCSCGCSRCSSARATGGASSACRAGARSASSPAWSLGLRARPAARCSWWSRVVSLVVEGVAAGVPVAPRHRALPGRALGRRAGSTGRRRRARGQRLRGLTRLSTDRSPDPWCGVGGAVYRSRVRTPVRSPDPVGATSTPALTGPGPPGSTERVMSDEVRERA